MSTPQTLKPWIEQRRREFNAEQELRREIITAVIAGKEVLVLRDSNRMARYWFDETSRDLLAILRGNLSAGLTAEMSGSKMQITIGTGWVRFVGGDERTLTERVRGMQVDMLYGGGLLHFRDRHIITRSGS